MCCILDVSQHLQDQEQSQLYFFFLACINYFSPVSIIVNRWHVDFKMCFELGGRLPNYHFEQEGNKRQSIKANLSKYHLPSLCLMPEVSTNLWFLILNRKTSNNIIYLNAMYCSSMKESLSDLVIGCKTKNAISNWINPIRGIHRHKQTSFYSKIT